MSTENPEVLKLVKGIADDVEASRADLNAGLMSVQESQAKFERQMKDVHEEQRKEFARQQLPPPEFLVERESDSIHKAGLFGGIAKLPFEKMLALSSQSEAVKGTRAEEQLDQAHLLHDACLFTYWHVRRKNQLTHRDTIKKMSRESDDFKAYLGVLDRMGYVKANEVVDPDNTSDGFDNLTFELLSAQVVDRVRQTTLMPRRVRNVQLTRPQMKFNVRTADIIAVRGGVAPPSAGQITPVGPNHPGSHLPAATYFKRPQYNAVQFDAGHIMQFIAWDDDIVSESVIPITQVLREDLVRGLSRGLEKAILDGDAGAYTAHQDFSITGGSDENLQIETAWNGFRFLCTHNDTTTPYSADGAAVQVTNAVSEADIVAALNKLHRFAGVPSELTLALPLKAYHQMLLNGNVITLDKFGSGATIKSGTLGFFMGIEIILPEFMSRYDLDENGLEISPVEAKGWGLLYREDRFWLGQYGTPRIETTRNAPLLHTVLQVDCRYDFKAVDVDLLDTTSPGIGQFAASLPDYPACALLDIDVTTGTA